MKGIIFAELAEYAAGTLPAMAEAPVASVYDVHAVYPHHDLIDLAARVSRLARVPLPELLCGFGIHLFARFAALYPVFFVEADAAIPFLTGINGAVHDEVQKIYPDAQLPRFDCRGTADGGLEMTYRSGLGLADLAEGLIRGCVAHFGDPVEVRREDTPGEPPTASRFVLRAGAAP